MLVLMLENMNKESIHFVTYRLHDRKIAVLGLCTLIDTPSTRPQAINGISAEIIPALIMLFTGLKRAYASE